VKIEVGDMVRILSKGMDSDDSYLERHRAYDGREGKVTRVDHKDDTAHIEVGEDIGWWFRMAWLSVIISSQKSNDGQYCSCGGPKKTVVILFQPIQVCETCKKEKRS